MLVVLLMLATDGAQPNLRVWAGTSLTQDFTNTSWKVVLNIWKLEMSNIWFGPSLTSLKLQRRGCKKLVTLEESNADVVNANG